MSYHLFNLCFRFIKKSKIIIASYSSYNTSITGCKVKIAQLGPTLCDPMGYIVMEFSRPEYWSKEPFPSPGDLPS